MAGTDQYDQLKGYHDNPVVKDLLEDAAEGAWDTLEYWKKRCFKAELDLEVLRALYEGKTNA